MASAVLRQSLRCSLMMLAALVIHGLSIKTICHASTSPSPAPASSQTPSISPPNGEVAPASSPAASPRAGPESAATGNVRGKRSGHKAVIAIALLLSAGFVGAAAMIYKKRRDNERRAMLGRMRYAANGYML